jgi:putative membrane protein insertion efficiency factor
MNIAQKGLIFIIRIYQLTLSPVLATALGASGRCRFTPSCSQYAREAIHLHGAVRGGCLAGWRLCRCHPWGDFGEDYPPKPGNPWVVGRALRARPTLPQTAKIDGLCKTGHCHGS